VFVFEDDIDVTSYEQMDWAIAYRVNAGHGGIVISPGLLGHALDPSTPLEERDVEQLGAGIWNRVLIDATRNWSFKRRPEWNNERFPPTVAPAPEDEAPGAGALERIRLRVARTASAGRAQRPLLRSGLHCGRLPRFRFWPTWLLTPLVRNGG
jgi:3-polyprenyl-4-hydroxybenzoate decarboxylase